MTQLRFEVVSVRLPKAAMTLWGEDAVDVPARFLSHRYVVSREPMVVSENGRNLLCFADIGPFYQVCLDLESGQVVDRMPTVERVPQPINSSLQAFRDCVRFVVDRFPFYGKASDLSERVAVAQELADGLARIDPEAMADKDGFWRTFTDDVEIGDYATEEFEP